MIYQRIKNYQTLMWVWQQLFLYLFLSVFASLFCYVVLKRIIFKFLTVCRVCIPNYQNCLKNPKLVLLIRSKTKQWPLAGEFVEFEYSPKICQFGKFEYSPKWPFPPFWPDSIHSPAIHQLLSPDSIHSTDIRQPLSPDAIHSWKANLHKFSKFSEFGKFSECRLDRFIYI